jgi:uncharacterized protein (TIGR00299 family) protein
VASGRLLHLDCFSGIAGNMVLGALLDLGLPRAALARGLEGLGVAHRLRVSKVRRGALAARYVQVQVPRSPGRRRAHGRRYAEIRALLAKARLPQAARARAQAIFAALAEAEARVHGIAVEDVHFHEVGAVDALVDVAGAALGLELLGVARVTASPVALGHGTVETDHGTLPLPAPATLELLRGIPTVPAHAAFETVTPTGAAILRAVVDEFRTLPAMTVEAIGHGAGNDRPDARLPNVLRAVLGRDDAPVADRVVVLEAHLDDAVPEHFEHWMERLFEAGALDVAFHPLQMKKSRLGYALRVVAPPDRRAALAAIVLDETPTLGVRAHECERLLVGRETLRVQTPFGPVRVKRSRAPGGRLELSAEVDDCRRAARQHGVALREVVRVAEAVAREELG